LTPFLSPFWSIKLPLGCTLGSAKNTVLAYTLFLACQGKNGKIEILAK
jgi:hypothetical protein